MILKSASRRVLFSSDSTDIQETINQALAADVSLKNLVLDAKSVCSNAIELDLTGCTGRIRLKGITAGQVKIRGEFDHLSIDGACTIGALVLNQTKFNLLTIAQGSKIEAISLKQAHGYLNAPDIQVESVEAIGFKGGMSIENIQAVDVCLARAYFDAPLALGCCKINYLKLEGAEVNHRLSTAPGFNIGSLSAGRMQAAKAILAGGVISEGSAQSAYLTGSTFSGTKMTNFSLRYANITSANLDKAVVRLRMLCHAQVDYASFVGVKINLNTKRTFTARSHQSHTVVTLPVMGSRDDSPVAIRTSRGWVVSAGCFTGTIAELKEASRESHRGKPRYAKQYEAALALLHTL